MKDITDYFKSSSQDAEDICCSNNSSALNEPTAEEMKEIKNSRKSKRSVDENLRKRSVDENLSKTNCIHKNSSTSTTTIFTEGEKNNIIKNSNPRSGLYEVNDNCREEIIEDHLRVPNPNTAKTNAFQFLMNSRNRIIGSNSEGKELIDDNQVIIESPKKLESRKKLLQEWSESIKAQKRKLQDDEIDKCIKKKLNVRKKRFKKLLKAISSDDEVSGHSSDLTVSSQHEIVNIEQISPNKTNMPELKKRDHKREEGNKTEDTFVKRRRLNSQIIKKKKLKKKSKCSIRSLNLISTTKPTKQWKMRIKLLNDLCNTNEINGEDHNQEQSLSDDELCHRENSSNTENYSPNVLIEEQSEESNREQNYQDDSKCFSDVMKKNSNEHENSKVSQGIFISSDENSPNIKDNEKVSASSTAVKTENKGKSSLDYSHDHTNKLKSKTVKMHEHKNKHIKNLRSSTCDIVSSKCSDESSQKNKSQSKSTKLAPIFAKPLKSKVEAINTGKGLKKKKDSECSFQDNPSSTYDKRVLRDRGNRTNNYAVVLSDESDGESKQSCKIKKKLSKVAPVFEKSIPKPKVDVEILEARRKFLLSDMPDVLKRKIEKKESFSVNTPELDVFPKISHICQRSTEPFWNLPDINLFTNRISTFSEYIPQTPICNSIINHSTIEKSTFEPSERIKNVKTIIRDMKFENTNYPVYKSFRLLKEKIDPQSLNTNIKRRSKSRRSADKKKNMSEKIIEKKPEDHLNREYLMWTEKYKPRCLDDLIGNYNAASALKKWLENWDEVLKSVKSRKRSYSSDSESDFLSSDADSLVDYRSLHSTIILIGPHGSGKSSSVYAICDELGMKVLEINASSKRTGKNILQELQEATQSHQVPKSKEIIAFTKKQSIKKKANLKENAKSKKICVLLIEDIDLVFEQDEGFISAISQISTISKRPIILTTSNKKSTYSQKFINEYKSIEFQALSAKSVGIWLQILCLLEGIFVHYSAISEFLEYNKGDMRKTILQLQFWVQSGGQMNKLKNTTNHFENEYQTNEESGIITMEDDASNMSLKEQEQKPDNFRTHLNLISDFEIFQLEQFYNLPMGLDLRTLWWNIPRFLNLENNDSNKYLKKSKRNKSKLKKIADMYDSISLCDISYRKLALRCDSPVCPTRWGYSLQDSLELQTTLAAYSSNADFLLEWNHYMVDKCLNVCKERFSNISSENQRIINMGLPGITHSSQVMKKNDCERELLNPVPVFNHLNRKTVSMDYLSTLRNIARSEKNRAERNMKRHNRFHNYLQNLNIDCNNMVLSHAIETLQINN